MELLDIKSDNTRLTRVDTRYYEINFHIRNLILNKMRIADSA